MNATGDNYSKAAAAVRSWKTSWTSSSGNTYSASIDIPEPTYIGTSTAHYDSNWNLVSSWQSATYSDSYWNKTTWTDAIAFSPISNPSSIASWTSPTNTTNTTSTWTTNKGTQWNSSTIGSSSSTWGWTMVRPWSSQETNIARVIDDSTKNYKENVATDKAKYDKTKAVTEGAYNEQQQLMINRQAELTFESQQIDLEQKKRAQEDADAQKAIQEAEKATMEANIAATEASNQAAEAKAAQDAEVARMQSAVTFAKLGMTLSSAWINTAQQIYTQWVMQLAEIKTRNSYNIAKLKNDFAKVEFDHTATINKIIRDSEDTSYKLRQDLSKSIYDIRQNIVMNKLEKQEAMNKIAEDYKKARDDNEKSILDKLKAANGTLNDMLSGKIDTLKKQEDYSNSKINTAVESGTWYTLPPAERAKLEKQAGLPTWTIERKVASVLASKIFEEMKGLPISANELETVRAEALRLMQLGSWMEAALASALLKSKTYQTQLARANSKKYSSWGVAKSSKLTYVDTRKWEDGVWYDAYKDPTTWKLITEKSTIQYNEWGKLSTVKWVDSEEDI